MSSVDIYYDRNGKSRRLSVDRDCCGYRVYLDGKCKDKLTTTQKLTR